MKFIVALFLFPSLSFAHGEDKPGPHGGHIKMPGAFHTEMLMAEDQSLHIYLLDMNFKNPSVKDSKVSVRARHKKKDINYTCSIMDNSHFHCTAKEKVPHKASILLTAEREKAPGNEVTYELPLASFSKSKPQNSSDTHHNHH